MAMVSVGRLSIKLVWATNHSIASGLLPAAI